MSHLQNFGTQDGAAGTVKAVTVPSGISVGATIVVAVLIHQPAHTTPPTVTDSKGNAYRQLRFTGSGDTRVSLFAAVATTALTTSDTITVSRTYNRLCVSIDVYSESLWGDGDGDTAAIASGTACYTPAVDIPGGGALVVGCVGIITSSRTFTAGSGYSAGTKQVTATTTNRALYSFWGYGSAPSSTPGGDLNNTSQAMVEAAVLLPGTPPSTGQTVKIWDGSAAQDATVLGVWNGTSVDPATRLGAWDGSAVQPLT